MSEVNWRDVASNVLRMCKDIDPLFFGAQAQARMVQPWAIILMKSGLSPADIYEGVTAFYATAAPDSRPNVSSILSAARESIKNREMDQSRRDEVVERRRRREEERDKALREGTWRPKGIA